MHAQIQHHDAARGRIGRFVLRAAGLLLCLAAVAYCAMFAMMIWSWLREHHEAHDYLMLIFMVLPVVILVFIMSIGYRLATRPNAEAMRGLSLLVGVVVFFTVQTLTERAAWLKPWLQSLGPQVEDRAVDMPTMLLFVPWAIAALVHVTLFRWLQRLADMPDARTPAMRLRSLKNWWAVGCVFLWLDAMTLCNIIYDAGSQSVVAMFGGLAGVLILYKIIETIAERRLRKQAPCSTLNPEP